MSKRSKRKRKKSALNKQDAEIREALNEPWLAKRSGVMMMGVLSVGFALFMIWQLYPTEGVGRSILWGLGSGVALWLIFFLGLGFNKLVRR